MPAPIVVEVYAPAPRPAELAALLTACSRAAAPKECVSSEVKSAEPPLGVAIVRREGDRARIELGLRSAPSAEWSTRDLTFQPGDDELERYRAIGFAIGTLVAGQQGPRQPGQPGQPAEPAASPRPSKPEAAPETLPPPLPKPKAERTTRASSSPDEPPEPEPEPEPPPPRRTYRSAWLDATGSVGLGLIPGPPRVGGALRGAFELVPHSFFAVVEGGYGQRFGDDSLRVQWLSVSAGLGHPLAPDLRSFGVDVRVMATLERISVTATEGIVSESDARFKPGVTAAIDGHWDIAPPVGLVLSAATFIDPKRTVVRSASEDVGETPSLGLSGFVGLRFRLR